MAAAPPTCRLHGFRRMLVPSDIVNRIDPGAGGWGRGMMFRGRFRK